MIKNEDGTITMPLEELQIILHNLYIMYGVSLTLPNTFYSDALRNTLESYEKILNS